MSSNADQSMLSPARSARAMPRCPSRSSIQSRQDSRQPSGDALADLASLPHEPAQVAASRDQQVLGRLQLLRELEVVDGLVADLLAELLVRELLALFLTLRAALVQRLG